MAARNFMYSLLKRAFIQEPNKEFLETLVNEDILRNVPFTEESESIREGSETVFMYLQDPELLEKDNIDQLAADFANLYYGPGSLKAPPWESVYLSDKGLVFQDETIEVRKEYMRNNLLPEKYKDEPDDHIALELDFMAHLSTTTSKNLREENFREAKKYLKKQYDFLKNHLSLWVGRFSKNTVKNARLDYLRGMAQMLDGFISLDMKTIEALIEDLSLRTKKLKSVKSVKK